MRDIEVDLPGGETKHFGELAPGVALVVNVASKCGHTPQYAGLEALYREFRDRGLTVVGMPCNQFAFQEPGSDAAIAEFCSLNYDVTFPLLAKGKVNGRHATPLFRALTAAEDADGEAGRVRWNFEKFVVWPARDGEVPRVERFRSDVEPEDPTLRSAIESALAA